MKLLNFLLFLWVLFAPPGSDTDPLDLIEFESNQDPDPKTALKLCLNFRIIYGGLGKEPSSNRVVVPALQSRKLSSAMGARKQVGIGLSYRPASLCSLATRVLESIPRPIAGLKFPTLAS
jgi:hypothetical protein